MNKILAKIMLFSLVFSTASMQGSGLSSLWNKHNSAILTSLYVLGCAAVTYACHKDVAGQVKALKKEKDSYLLAHSLKPEDLTKKFLNPKEKEHKKKLDEYDNRMKYYYSKPVDVAAFFTVLGGSIKLYNAYFR